MRQLRKCCISFRMSAASPGTTTTAAETSVKTTTTAAETSVNTTTTAAETSVNTTTTMAENSVTTTTAASLTMSELTVTTVNNWETTVEADVV